MRLGKVIGTVIATTKDAALVGGSLLIVDLTDAKGKQVEAGHVALDGCGAGVGDTVLISHGSAPRMPQGKPALPNDPLIGAIVDRVSLN